MCYKALLVDIAIQNREAELDFNYIPRRPNHVILWQQSHPEPPRLATEYTPLTVSPDMVNKEWMLLLAAYETTHESSPTPFTPDSIPLVIDTGASIF
jgi:hypothetical protein